MPFSGFQDLDPAFGAALEEMIGQRPGISPFSGYRTIERQRQLYEAAVRKYGSPEAARKWVAPPGKSRHNMRRAVDLRFASGADREWAHAHAGEFGLYFPMSYEPWHIEPVNAHATSAAGAQAQVTPMQPTMQPAQPMQEGPSSYMQGIMGIAQGGGSDWMQNRSYSTDAIIGDVLAGHNPMRRYVMQKIMGLFP